MENCKKEIEQYLTMKKDAEESKQMMRKLKKSKSYLSMENIIVDDESDMSPSDASDRAREEDLPLSGLSSENVIIHPENVLENAFRKLTTVGSATALVGIRN
mmetsp:Transcript_47329/g.34620  ORF Transcript_47329/g.34620 Transcript_47329/m.34620 type:complete len:102 (+) Transcript_47329:535-840(+)